MISFREIIIATKKKTFNKFTLAEAYDFLGLAKLQDWEIGFSPVEPTTLFEQYLKRLDAFDLVSSESGKEVLIDAILNEALARRTQLKVWKEVYLKTAEVSGRSEYVLAQRIDILKHPFVCLTEAKKDDFENGLAQCLVGMKVCQFLNQQVGVDIDMYGIVTNAYAWRFCKLTLQNEVLASPFYSFQTQTAVLFGILDSIFKACEQNLRPPQSEHVHA